MEEASAASRLLGDLGQQVWLAPAAASSSFRRNQCLVLFNRCLQVDGYILAWRTGSREEFLALASSAMGELVRIFQRIKWTVAEAQVESWLPQALVRHHGEEEFASLLQDLEAFVELLRDKMPDRLSIVKRKALEESVLAKQWLEEAAVRDREKLIQELKQIAGADDGIGAVADYLLYRLKESELEAAECRLLEIRDEVTPSEVLGLGASGLVFTASWLSQEVAVKCFRLDDLTYPREKEAIRKLVRPHPNILQVLGYSTDSKGQGQLVMELMKMDLRKYIEQWKAPIPLLLAVDIMLQIARGTRYLHDRNVVHRDLKPQNILVHFEELGGAVRVRLTDFGIAKTDFETRVPEDLTQDKGTVRYMAPEMLERKAYSRKVEVWSFAVSCSEILTRKMPFAGYDGDRKDLKRRLRDGVRPQLPEDCPDQLKRLIQECWDGDPKQRPNFKEIEERLASLKTELLWGPQPGMPTFTTTTTTTTSPMDEGSRPRIEKFHFRGDSNVGGKVSVQFELANGAECVVCRWTRVSQNGEPESMDPVTYTERTGSKALTYHITAADYGKKLTLDCTALGPGLQPGVRVSHQINNGGPIRCGRRLTEKIERYFKEGQAHFQVEHLRQKWWETNGKLFINQRDFLLWWGQGNARNLRYVFAEARPDEESPLELCGDDEAGVVCNLRGKDGSGIKIKFLDKEKRDEAVLTMKYFWDRRHQQQNRNGSGSGSGSGRSPRSPRINLQHQGL